MRVASGVTDVVRLPVLDVQASLPQSPPTATPLRRFVLTPIVAGIDMFIPTIRDVATWDGADIF
jgi:hypothetical protein